MKKIICDIDETICYYKGKTRDYKLAIPHKNRIEIMNELFDDGNEVHYWTARGSSSGIDHLPLTKNQLDEWNVKYTTVSCGKPSYDFWIDDKAFRDGDWFNSATLRRYVIGN